MIHAGNATPQARRPRRPAWLSGAAWRVDHSVGRQRGRSLGRTQPRGRDGPCGAKSTSIYIRTATWRQGCGRNAARSAPCGGHCWSLPPRGAEPIITFGELRRTVPFCPFAAIAGTLAPSSVVVAKLSDIVPACRSFRPLAGLCFPRRRLQRNPLVVRLPRWGAGAAGECPHPTWFDEGGVSACARVCVRRSNHPGVIGTHSVCTSRPSPHDSLRKTNPSFVCTLLLFLSGAITDRPRIFFFVACH